MAKEKEKGQCQVCDKKPRILNTLESGQKLCNRCLREIRPPENDDATDKQLAFLKDLGFQIPPNCTKGIAGQLIDSSKEVGFYLMDAWEMMTGKRPKHSGIRHDEIRRLASRIIQLDNNLAKLMIDEQERRERVMYELQDRDQQKARDMGDWEANFHMLDYKQGIRHDGTYAKVSSLLRSEFRRDLPLHHRIAQWFSARKGR